MKLNEKLIGVVAGDMIGSVYERFPTKELEFPLFSRYSRFTDDTVMTMAHADWLLHGGDLARMMQRYGRKYPRAGNKSAALSELWQWFRNAGVSGRMGV